MSELLPFLRQLGTERRFRRGELLIEQGRHDRLLFYLLDGAVEVTRSGERVKQISAGDIVGEFAFIDNRPRTASVRALGELSTIELDRETILKTGEDNLLLLSRFLSLITARMNSRMRSMPSASPESFLAQVSAEALSHRAVNHPYLQDLASGNLPDMRWALADFGRQYYAYSSHFPRYLTKTISQLTDPAHRQALMENLTEESGIYHEDDLAALQEAGIELEWIQGVPHPELFKRFCDALGVGLSDVEDDQLEVICWREMFLDVLGKGSPAQAIGALGLGTEGVVQTMYQNFLPALRQVDLNPADTVFFPLHAMVDDHHQATLLKIARDFADTEQGRRDLRKGMRKALFLRAGFWDWMHLRARNPQR